MEPLTIGILMMVLLALALVAGFHVGIALLGVGLLGVWLIVGDLMAASRMIADGVFYVVFDYFFAVIPLFVLMGLLASVSGATHDLYDSAKVWLGGVRGGLAITTVVANAVFAAVTGVSAASVIVFSKIAMPEMLRMGYDKKLTVGTIAGSSVLGMLIPPSTLLIIYGLFSEIGIGRVFMAGVIPGVILAIIFIGGISLMGIRNPSLMGSSHLSKNISFLDRLRAIGKVWSIVSLILLVLGGIYAGLFTPTEAASVGAVGALLLALAKKRLTISSLWNCLLETGRLTAVFFFLFIGAQMFGRMLAISGLAQALSTGATTIAIPNMVIVVIFLVVFLVLGTFLDSVSIMVITLPIMLPVIEAMGFALIWFGIVAVVTIEMGLLTPPFGMQVFIMKGTIGEQASVEEIYRACLPFLLMMLITVILLLAFPILSTWLPSTMLT